MTPKEKKKVTYLYVNGIIVRNEIPLTDSLTLLPNKTRFDLNVASNLIKRDIDYSIAVLSENNMYAQLKVVAKTEQDLVAYAWNSYWDCLLLGALINNDVMCNLQSDQPIANINQASFINVTNYFLRGIKGISKVITDNDEAWIKKHYKTAKDLLDDKKFETAVHCMATYHWHSHPRVQLSILWSGIESLFDVSAEVSFRVSLYISNYLCDSKDEAKTLFESVKEIYNARSAAVHGGNRKLKKSLDEYVEDSAEILNKLIKKCSENGGLPNTKLLVF